MICIRLLGLSMRNQAVSTQEINSLSGMVVSLQNEFTETANCSCPHIRMKA